jgi:hypothetical protein
MGALDYINRALSSSFAPSVEEAEGTLVDAVAVGEIERGGQPHGRLLSSTEELLEHVPTTYHLAS